MKLRKLQTDVLLEYTKQNQTQDYQDVLLNAVTGSGKSKCPLIAFHKLKAHNRIEKLLMVVPRESLKRQFAESALEGIEVFGGRSRISLEINEATNEIDPSRGLDGYVTTYHALAADTGLINAAELERYSYLLVLDECHHVSIGSCFERALLPLMELANHRLLMTGTLARGDQKQISFLPYITAGESDALKN
jgi:superfamily II DNA or RNA helicase